MYMLMLVDIVFSTACVGFCFIYEGLFRFNRTFIIIILSTLIDRTFVFRIPGSS